MPVYIVSTWLGMCPVLYCSQLLKRAMVSYLQGQKQRVRVTLEFDVYSDFNARDINYDKLFNLEGDEKVEVYVEDVNDLW